MEILTRHQKEALSKFPDNGWHRVDSWYDDEAREFCLMRRPEFTAEILGSKGFLESKVSGTNRGLGFGLYREYRKLSGNQTK